MIDLGTCLFSPEAVEKGGTRRDTRAISGWPVPRATGCSRTRAKRTGFARLMRKCASCSADHSACAPSRPGVATDAGEPSRSATSCSIWHASAFSSSRRRGADGIVVTGIVNENMVDALGTPTQPFPIQGSSLPSGVRRRRADRFQGSSALRGIPRRSRWISGSAARPIRSPCSTDSCVFWAGSRARVGGNVLPPRWTASKLRIEH